MRYPHLQTIEHHFSRMEASSKRRPAGAYSNLETYTNKTKESSLPNVRSRSTINDPHREKYHNIGQKRMESLLNRTRDRPSKHQSLPNVNQNKAKLAHTHQSIKLKGHKNGRKSDLRSRSRKHHLSPRPKAPKNYNLSPNVSPKAEKKENK